MEALLQAWEIHCRIHAFFIEALSDAQWTSKPEKGKSVRDQFSHCHNVRLMWLKASAPDLLDGLEKLEEATPREVIAGLEASGRAVGQMIEEVGDPGGRIKNFKPHASAFVAYLIAHESHHRGMAELALRQANLPLEDKVSYGLWEWGSR